MEQKGIYVTCRMDTVLLLVFGQSFSEAPSSKHTVDPDLSPALCWRTEASLGGMLLG